MAGLSAKVHGVVQGVGFRYYVRRMARELGVTGCVHNTQDGMAVEVQAEGEREVLDELIKLLQIGPRSARVDRMNIEWLEYKNAFRGFEVLF